MAATINIEDLWEKLHSGMPLYPVDVRSAAEFAGGHIPGAVNIPMEQMESRMADLPQGPLLLICETGKRADIVAGWLAGHSDVKVLEGGTRAWREAGHKLVVCAPCRWSLERQVRLIAGVLVLASSVLTLVLGFRWVYLAMFIGAGLTFAGLTNICGMAMVLAKLPWNRAQKAVLSQQGQPQANCCT